MGTRQEYLASIEASLEAALPDAQTCHPALRAAMAHAVLGGGKRLRPLLLDAAMQLGDYDETVSLRAGAALELLHSYSLVHDDLPAMDDDDLRRGRPTCHRVYGEAMAILAGDALQALAFEQLILALEAAGLSGGDALAALREFAVTAGPERLVGGQAGDLEPPGSLGVADQVHWIHARKTAALIRCSIVLGGRLARLAADELAELGEAGQLLGLAFQAVDDLLDQESSREELGKTPGKDLALGKRTLPAAIGAAATRDHVERLLASALALLPERAGSLRALADRLVHRRS